MGYYGIFVGMHYSNDQAMRRTLDADVYDQSQSITLKVSVSIPYMPDQVDFSRATGKFEHQGHLYRIVKQRYAQDTLTVICVRDIEHEKIDTMLTDYVKTFTDNATHESKGTGSKFSITFIKDYLPGSFCIRSTCDGWSAEVVLTTNRGTLVPSFTSSIVHPPERA